MAQSSSIEWTGSTWNPVTGCAKISPGCLNCYAERMAKRLQAMGQPNYASGFKLALHEHALDLPLKWKKPQTIFVNSMSDLFHKDVPVEYIQKIFKVIKENPQHLFQVLTKRSDILRYYDSEGWLEWPQAIEGTNFTVDADTIIVAIGAALEVPFLRLWGHEKEITTCTGYVDEYPAALAFLADGRVRVEPLVTEKIHLEDLIEKGIQEMIKNPIYFFLGH